MRLKWILATLSALLLLPVLLLTALLTYLHTTDLGKHRDFIAGHVSAVLGRELSLNGELDLDLSMTPSVVISDIALANASWASAQNMLTIQRVEVRIELKPLLRGDIHVPRFHVRGVKSLFETSAEGQGNWVFVESGDAAVKPGTGGVPAEFKLPWLGDVNISDVELTYHDGQTGQRVNANLEHALISSASPESPVVLDISGQVDNNPVEINGQLVLPAKLTAESFDIPVELHATVLDLKFDANGTVSGTATTPAIELSVRANAENLNQLRQVFGDAVPDVHPVKLIMDVEGEQGQPVTMALNAIAGEAVLDTRLMLHRDGPRPKLSGKLDLRDVDVVRLWAPLFADGPDQAATTETKTTPSSPSYQLDQPIDFRWLESFDADVVIAADNVKLPQLEVNSLRSHVRINDSKVVIDETMLVTGAGSVTASLQLNARGMKPDIGLDLNTTNIVLRKLQPLSENKRLVGGTVRAAVSLTAQGETVSGLIENLQGKAQLDYNNQKQKEKLSINLKRVSDKASSQRTLVVAADGLIDGHAIELSGDVIPPAGFLTGDKPYAVNLVVNGLGVSARINGTVEDPVGLSGVDLGIKAKAANLDGLRPLLGQDVPDVGTTELATRLTFSPSKLRLSKLQARLGDSRIEGWVQLNPAASIPDLKADLTFYDLNLDKLIPPDNNTADKKSADVKPAEKTVDGRLLSDAPLPFDTLAQANVQAKLRVINLVRNNNLLKQAEIKIDLTDSRLAVILLKHTSIKGELDGEIVLDARGQKKPTVLVRLKAPHIELAELLFSTDGAAAVEGPVATDILLRGRGNSVAQILATLNGKVHLLLEEGSADAKALDLFVGGLGAMFGTIFIDQSSKTQINCAISDLKFNNGVLTPQLAVLDTQYSTVFLEGQVDLSTEQLDIKVSPEAKGVTLSVAFPVLVKGTFAKPNIDIEKKGALLKTGELWATVAYPPAALVKFSDLGGGENPCVSMVAEKGGIPFVEDIGKAVGGAVKGVGGAVKGVGGVVKDAGSGLGKIFDSADEDTGSSAETDYDVEEDDDFDDY